MRCKVTRGYVGFFSSDVYEISEHLQIRFNDSPFKYYGDWGFRLKEDW